MKLVLYKLFVFTAFSLLLAHNIIPHHHHHDASQIRIIHDHHGEKHGHGHSPLTFHHIDEVFLIQSAVFKVAVHKFFTADLPHTFVFVETPEADYSGFNSVVNVPPPLLAFLNAFSFRGPPLT